MNATSSSIVQGVNARVAWPTLVLTALVVAVGYFAVNLVQRRRFYRDLVRLPSQKKKKNFAFNLLTYILINPSPNPPIPPSGATSNSWAKPSPSSPSTRTSKPRQQQ